MNKLRIFSVVVALFWLSLAVLSWGGIGAVVEIPTQVIAAAAVVAFAVYGFNGASKLTAALGKVLIAISLIALITQLINGAPELGGIDTILRTLGLVSGLVLERISPHQQIYPWMFLMIATKVELVIVGAFIALTAEVAGVSIGPLWWWAIIPLMLLGVIFLATGKQILYRAVILFTTVYALLLALDLILTQSPSGAIVAVAVSVVVWPFITERLIGYRAFRTKSQ